MSTGTIFEFHFSDIATLGRNNTVFLTTVGITGTAILAWRKWLSGGWCKSTTRLDGKTVIITGGNTGIGKATAMELASRGARIIIACRDVLKGEVAAAEIVTKVSGAEIVVHHLDLASFASIQNFAREINAVEPHIHVLINNAGLACTPESRTKDGYEMQFGVNHLGHFLLTRLLLKKIQSSVPARIINLSSLAHIRGKIHFDNINFEDDYGPFKAYYQSKLANVLFSRELASRLHGSGITVYCVNPGPVHTELGRNLGESTNWLTKTFFYLISYLVFKTPEQGAQTSIYCAVDEEIQAESGLYYSDCSKKDPAPQALDDFAAHRLWELSQELVGLHAAK